MKTKVFSVQHSDFPVYTLLALTLMALPPMTRADTLGTLSVGQDLSHGGASHPGTIQSALHNPASPSAAERRGLWFGLGGVSAGYELGDISDFEQRLDDISESLEDEFTTFQEAEEVRDEINAFIADLGEHGYANIQARALPPLMPLGGGLPGVGGQFSLGLGALANARIEFLDDEMTVSGPDGAGNFTLDSDSAAYIKGAAGAVASLGYSSKALFRRDGELTLGMRLNRYELELSKGVHRLDNEDDSGESADMGDGLEDEFDRNAREVSATGVDLGLLWTARRYRLGAILYNVNEPAFDYPRVGENCSDPSLSTNEQNNCNTAQQFPDRVQPAESHTMEQQLQLEAGVFSENRNWSLTTTYDVSSAEDVIGNDQQWYALTGSYSPQSWWIPGMRLGYQANQAGSELSYYTGGLTLFRVINIDAAVSRETVEVDDEEAPRSARVSLGLELFF